MAEKRMFSRSIIETDNFLDMPNSAKCLYFMLNLNADDDGFVTSPKAVVRVNNSSEDDIKILVAKNFIISFYSGVILITHWKINNYIQKDRYKPTICKEIGLVGINDRGEYYLLQSEIKEIDNVKQVEDIKIEEKIEEHIQDTKDFSEVEKIINEYKSNYKELFDKGILRTQVPIVDWTLARQNVKDAISDYGFENILLSMSVAKNDDFVIRKGYSINLILSKGVLACLLNNTDKDNNEKNIDIEKKRKEKEEMDRTRPRKCECGIDLVDVSNGYKSIWFCPVCEKEYVYKDKKWSLVERVNSE